jgi:hypothetical protein
MKGGGIKDSGSVTSFEKETFEKSKVAIRMKRVIKEMTLNRI